MNDFQPGTPVIIWGRPESNLILLFGEGHYEGTTFFNGNYWPTVRLANGREVTVHQVGISIGRADAVARTCKSFEGDVIEWDLDAFLRGEKPTAEQRRHMPMTNNNTNSMPPPKTASDRVLYLKKEIELQRAKIKVAEKCITDANAIIAAKEKEIAESTQSVLSELASVNPNFLQTIVEQVAAKLKAEPEKPIVMADLVPVTQPVAAPAPAPSVVRIVQPQTDPVEVDHTKLATED